MSVRQYVGARYVPKFFENPNGSAEWIKDTTYEPLTIVTYLNNSYTSKKPVPNTVGNPTDNTEYWANTGNYNAQIEDYRKITTETKKLLTQKTTYYTPEMFGAIGDGVTDDSEAIQECFNIIKDIKGTVLMTGTYFISKPVIISGWEIEVLGNSSIIYNGNDYAIKIHQCTESRLFFGSINSNGGGGILLYNTNENDYNQYVNLYVNKIKALTTCIKAETVNNSWNNEIRIYNTRLSTFNYTKGGSSKGIHIISNNITNGWRIENVGFEDINYGLYTDINGVNKYFEGEIIDPRMSENFDKIIKTNGGAYIQLISENRFIRDEFFELSNETNGQIVGSYCNDGYGYISGIARIAKGNIVPGESIPHYKWTLPNSTNVFDLVKETNNGIVTDFVLQHPITYTIKLSDYYSNLGVNEFRVKVENFSCGLIIQDNNGQILFSNNNLTGNSIYYFHYDENTLLFSCSELYPTVPREVLANTLTLSNCTIDSRINHNGYRVNGSLINIAIVVSITSPATATISGLPIPSFGATDVPILCNCSNGKASIKGSTGVLTIENATAGTCVITSMYFGRS